MTKPQSFPDKKVNLEDLKNGVRRYRDIKLIRANRRNQTTGVPFVEVRNKFQI